MRKSILEKIFGEKQISTKREQHRPSTVFDRQLAEWETHRGHDLCDGQHGTYLYYSKALRNKTRGVDQSFEYGEESRSEIRNGADKNDWWIDAYNDDPGRWIEVYAQAFGYRLVPLAKKTAVELKQPDFAFQVEKRVRSWLANADVIWEMLETLPGSRKNRESFAAYIHPLRVEARQIEKAVQQWLEIHYDMQHYQ